MEGEICEKGRKSKRDPREADARDQPLNHMASHGIRVKVRCTEVRRKVKVQRQKVDGNKLQLRKAGKDAVDSP